MTRLPPPSGGVTHSGRDRPIHTEQRPGVDKTGIGRVVHGVAEGFWRGGVTELRAEALGGVKRAPGGGDSTVSGLAGGI